MAQHTFIQLLSHYLPFLTRSHQIVATPCGKLPVERRIFPREEVSRGGSEKAREGIWNNSLPPTYRRFLEALLA